MTECSEHGTCIRDTQECYCDQRWGGADCNTPVCPGSPECSGMGTCEVIDDIPTCNCTLSMGDECEYPCIFGESQPTGLELVPYECICDPCYQGSL